MLHFPCKIKEIATLCSFHELRFQAQNARVRPPKPTLSVSQIPSFGLTSRAPNTTPLPQSHRHNLAATISPTHSLPSPLTSLSGVRLLSTPSTPISHSNKCRKTLWININNVTLTDTICHYLTLSLSICKLTENSYIIFVAAKGRNRHVAGFLFLLAAIIICTPHFWKSARPRPRTLW